MSNRSARRRNGGVSGHSDKVGGPVLCQAGRPEGLPVDYLLSKRTDAYLETVYQRASSGAPPVLTTSDPSSSRSQLLIAAGIRHRF